MSEGRDGMVRCAPSITSLCHRHASCSSHSQKLLRTAGPGGALPLTSERWCEGLSASQKARLLFSKKGTRSTRHGPQAKTQSKTAPAQFGGSKTAPRLEHSSQICTCFKNKRATGSPFSTTPVQNASGHSPACHLHYPTLLNSLPLRTGRRPHGVRLASGVGRSLPRNPI